MLPVIGPLPDCITEFFQFLITIDIWGYGTGHSYLKSFVSYRYLRALDVKALYDTKEKPRLLYPYHRE